MTDRPAMTARAILWTVSTVVTVAVTAHDYVRHASFFEFAFDAVLLVVNAVFWREAIRDAARASFYRKRPRAR